MEEKKKKNITVYVLVILLVLSIGVLSFLLISLNNKDKKYKELEEKYNKLSNEESEIKTLEYFNTNFDDLDFIKVVSYDNKIYVLESYELMNETITKLVTDGESLEYENNEYQFSNNGASGYIYKTDLTKNEISYVITVHNPYENPDYYVFFVMNDGIVYKLYYKWSTDLGSQKVLEVDHDFDNYNIKKITNYYCENYESDEWGPVCTSVKADVVLKDGTNKTITIK